MNTKNTATCSEPLGPLRVERVLIHTRCYTGRRKPGANVFGTLDHCLRETVSVNTHNTYKCKSPTECTDTANEDVILAAMEEESQ